MPRGYFITFEGLDGSGKTTQLRRLAATLQTEGHTVVTLRNPGGTALGDRIRSVLLDSKSEASVGPIAPAAEMALMFADRAQSIAEIVLPALAELGVGHLDVVLLSHPHPDHAGGLFAILDELPVGELWLTGESGPGNIGDLLRAKAAQRRIPVRTPPVGTVHMGELEVEVLRSRWFPARSTNDNSIVVRLVHGRVRLLLAGDVEALAEAELAQSGSDLRSDVLKAGHHGSRTSSTEAFLRAVRPSHVIFSVGAHNPFGFPHFEVDERARSFGAATWRTDRGAVTATSDGKALAIRQTLP